MLLLFLFPPPPFFPYKISHFSLPLNLPNLQLIKYSLSLFLFNSQTINFMENSVYSSAQQFPHPLPSFPSAADESGWTAYVDDPSDDAYSFASSSLLSDATSYAACKFSTVKPDPLPPVADHLNIPRKLTLTPKQTQFCYDISLEDTASSPDNSPKVSDLGPFDGNNYRRKSSLGNGRTTGEKYRGDHERNLDIGFKRKATEYTDLKKRGLCLVPLSMFTNYMD